MAKILTKHVFVHRNQLKKLDDIAQELKGHKLIKMKKLGGMIGDLVSDCCGEGCGHCVVCP